MNQALSTTQIVCGGIVFVLVLALLAVGILALAHRLFDIYYRRGQQDQYQRDVNRIRTGSAWFSEDVPTMNLMRNLVEYGDIGKVRDQWLRERADKTNNALCVTTHSKDAKGSS
jgi:hypothetical protein